jgi:hypothetical protein
VGKPSERERFYYSASGKYISAAITHFQPREKPLTASKNCPKNLCLDFHAKSVLLYNPPKKSAPRNPCKQSVVQTILYGPAATRKMLKTASKTVASLP